jgi:hypothetical protein
LQVNGNKTSLAYLRRPLLLLADKRRKITNIVMIFARDVAWQGNPAVDRHTLALSIRESLQAQAVGNKSARSGVQPEL